MFYCFTHQRAQLQRTGIKSDSRTQDTRNTDKTELKDKKQQLLYQRQHVFTEPVKHEQQYPIYKKQTCLVLRNKMRKGKGLLQFPALKL